MEPVAVMTKSPERSVEMRNMTMPNLFILTPLEFAVGAVPMRQQRVVSYARVQPSLPKLRWEQEQLSKASYNHW